MEQLVNKQGYLPDVIVLRATLEMDVVSCHVKKFFTCSYEGHYWFGFYLKEINFYKIHISFFLGNQTFWKSIIWWELRTIILLIKKIYLFNRSTESLSTEFWFLKKHMVTHIYICHGNFRLHSLCPTFFHQITTCGCYSGCTSHLGLINHSQPNLTVHANCSPPGPPFALALVTGWYQYYQCLPHMHVA